MATEYPRRPSYGIFVRFRQSRLSLRRGITHLEDALVLAEQLRANRFHDRGEIFVVKEPEGTVVTPMPPGTIPPSPPISTAPSPPISTASPSVAVAAEPRAEPRATNDPTTLAPILRRLATAGDDVQAAQTLDRERARVIQLIEQIDRMRRMIDRAYAALTRFERAFAVAEGLLHVHGGSPSDAFLRNHERLTTLRASAAKSVISFEQTAALLERRLESAWGDATLLVRACAV